MFKRIGQVLAASALVTGSLLGSVQAAEELNFGIISTESSQNLKAMWDPFLADMSKQTGVKINAFFAPDYAGIIQGMRFGQTVDEMAHDQMWIHPALSEVVENALLDL